MALSICTRRVQSSLSKRRSPTSTRNCCCFAFRYCAARRNSTNRNSAINSSRTSSLRSVQWNSLSTISQLKSNHSPPRPPTPLKSWRKPRKPWRRNLTPSASTRRNNESSWTNCKQLEVLSRGNPQFTWFPNEWPYRNRFWTASRNRILRQGHRVQHRRQRPTNRRILLWLCWMTIRLRLVTAGDSLKDHSITSVCNGKWRMLTLLRIHRYLFSSVWEC